MNKALFEAVETRRSVYALKKDSPISEERIVAIGEHAVKHTPSAFNSQSARAVFLFGEHHDALWDLTEGALKQVVPEEQFDTTREKIDSFRKGYGTVLFFEDGKVVQTLQKQFPLYSDNFPKWSQQSSGMLQYVLWTALASEGLGASLQHYNELIEDEVKGNWNLPKEWELIAQLPFGSPAAKPAEKTFVEIDKRLKVYR